MNKQLPERPDLEQLKKQAKKLLEEVHAGHPEALSRIGREDRETFALHDAQWILAREYGFESWPKLKLHVETRTESAAEARLVEASLDGDEAAMRIILAGRPALPQRSIHVAAALGDRDAVSDWLERNPAMATSKGGPREWEPLLYLCFGRCGCGDEPRAAVARQLLALGADANAHWLDAFWPDSPQPALYGATGVNNHPELARVLLEAGADPNDCESRYHAAENNHVESLAVLREFGTDFSAKDKVWGNTPLYFLLGWYKPAQAIKEGIRWLLEHGADPNIPSYTDKINEPPLHLAVRNGWETEVIELLLEHGADPRILRGDGRTAYALATQAGRDDVAALLLARGSPTEIEPVDRLLGACMRADEAGVRALLARQPGLVAHLTPDEKLLVHEAAKRGLAEAIALMAGLGMDMAASPAPGGETALHLAAWHGQAKAVAALLRAGVPIDVKDNRFHAPPIGWCAHGSLFCRDSGGDHAAVAAALIEARAEVPADTNGSPEVMAVIRAYRNGAKTSDPSSVRPHQGVSNIL